MSGSGRDRLWEIYPRAVQAAARGEFRTSTAQHTLESAALVGFLCASCVLIISPILMRLNHSIVAAVRRWRWMGIGLLLMVELSVMLTMAPGPIWPWPIHLFVLAHLILCAAILPWPRERVVTSSGFEVIVPGPSPRG